VSRAKILDLGTSAAAKPILVGELLGKATYSPQDKEDITEDEKIAAVLPAHLRGD
jgi:hypothetical protein